MSSRSPASSTTSARSCRRGARRATPPSARPRWPTCSGPRVADLVAHHDDAKRYLVTTEPRYRHRLSTRSLETLRLQGGLLDPEERAVLDRYPDLEALLTLRRADDAAKVPGARVPGLGHWRTVLEGLACPAA